MKDINEMTLEELQALAEAVSAKIAELQGEEKPEVTEAARSLMDGLTNNAEELNKLVDDILARQKSLTDLVEKRKALRSDVASGKTGTTVSAFGKDSKKDEREERAKKFAATGRETIDGEQVRSILVSGGDLATPTKATGINDIPGAHFSSILDYVYVDDCQGMGADKVAYVAADADTAAEQTEGSAATAKEPTYDYVTIQPTSVAVSAQISKQAKKQSPLKYEAKTQEQALISLKKKACALTIAAMKASELNQEVVAAVASGKGKVDQHTLRKLVLAYGGDEAVEGNAVLVLNKTDLIALGDVRGDNEKKAVYEITPNGTNPNVGTIKDGGLTVTYIIDKNVTACHGTAQTTSKIPTMFYGNMKNVKLDLFSPYEIRVSEDFAITSLMDTIVGDVELGVDVVAKYGIAALTIPATT